MTLDDLAKAMKTHAPKRDACGEYCITGRRGNIHADGKGFSIFASFANAGGLKAAIARIGPPRQHADTEGVWRMAASAAAGQVAALRWLIKPSKKRELTDEQRKVQTARLDFWRKSQAQRPQNDQKTA